MYVAFVDGYVAYVAAAVATAALEHVASAAAAPEQLELCERLLAMSVHSGLDANVNCKLWHAMGHVLNLTITVMKL